MSQEKTAWNAHRLGADELLLSTKQDGERGKRKTKATNLPGGLAMASRTRDRKGCKFPTGAQETLGLGRRVRRESRGKTGEGERRCITHSTSRCQQDGRDSQGAAGLACLRRWWRTARRSEHQQSSVTCARVSLRFRKERGKKEMEKKRHTDLGHTGFPQTLVAHLRQVRQTADPAVKQLVGVPFLLQMQLSQKSKHCASWSLRTRKKKNQQH